MSITLLELRTQVRQRANMEESAFISDSELNGYINNSIAELRDILCEAYGSEYFVKSSDTPISIVQNQARYDLPTDFYELKGVDVQIDGVNNGKWSNLRQFNFNERNRFTEFGFWDLTGLTNVRYRLIGDTIMFSPVPDRSAIVQLWYVPVAPKLASDSDTLNDFNAYSEYVIVDAAIKCLQKEESDVSVLMAQKMALDKRIRDKAQNRDASNSGSISDIYAENDSYYWRNGY